MSNPLNSPDRHKLIPGFEWNARNVFADSNSLYFRLTRDLIGDGKLLVLASNIPATQPAPSLFFSTAHYLLMRDENRDHPLREFFPDLAKELNTQDDPYPAFRGFCLDHATEMAEILRTRSVQVNEIGRCSYFLPAFQLISERLEGRPFIVIEVGCSAGLNLFWDHYAYEYGDGERLGVKDASIVLNCELRGEVRPPFRWEMPTVAFRLGIDLDPKDVRNDDAMLWLRALVWPEQVDRAKRLEKAIELARKQPPLILQGDALELVPRVLTAIAPETPVVLFHSFVLNQFPTETRQEFYWNLAAHRSAEQLFDLALEPNDWPARLVLTTYERGTASEETLAVCDHLGRWMEWLAPPGELQGNSAQT